MSKACSRFAPAQRVGLKVIAADFVQLFNSRPPACEFRSIVITNSV